MRLSTAALELPVVKSPTLTKKQYDSFSSMLAKVITDQEFSIPGIKTRLKVVPTSFDDYSEELAAHQEALSSMGEFRNPVDIFESLESFFPFRFTWEVTRGCFPRFEEEVLNDGSALFGSGHPFMVDCCKPDILVSNKYNSLTMAKMSIKKQIFALLRSMPLPEPIRTSSLVVDVEFKYDPKESLGDTVNRELIILIEITMMS